MSGARSQFVDRDGRATAFVNGEIAGGLLFVSLITDKMMRSLRHVANRNRRHDQIVRLARSERASEPIASLPDQKNKRGGQSSRDEHPVLAFETEKIEMLDQKLHRFRPNFWAE
jgi:Cys-tRNA synthase (O-phospho-L-seryl-tRNA:Cys-tRNA synthase)